MSEPYFAANECDERTHYFKRTGKGIEPFHLDDQVCGVSEYFLPDLDAPDDETRCRECGSTEAGNCFYCKMD